MLRYAYIVVPAAKGEFPATIHKAEFFSQYEGRADNSKVLSKLIDHKLVVAWVDLEGPDAAAIITLLEKRGFARPTENAQVSRGTNAAEEPVRKDVYG